MGINIIGGGLAGVEAAYENRVAAGGVDFSKGFWGSRYSEDNDYFNCVLTKEDNEHFYNKLIDAEKVDSREFEKNFLRHVFPLKR